MIVEPQNTNQADMTPHDSRAELEKSYHDSRRIIMLIDAKDLAKVPQELISTYHPVS
jgi:hypothetical protein